MSEIYPSTKALSVFNVLSISRQDMTPIQVYAFLRDCFDQNLPLDYVADGVEFLKRRSLVREHEGVLKIARLPTGLGTPVVRSADGRDLVRASY